MSIRLLEIEKCCECRNREWGSVQACYICGVTGKKLFGKNGHIEIIPDFCPLPKVEDDKETRGDGDKWAGRCRRCSKGPCWIWDRRTLLYAMDLKEGKFCRDCAYWCSGSHGQCTHPSHKGDNQCTINNLACPDYDAKSRIKSMTESLCANCAIFDECNDVILEMPVRGCDRFKYKNLCEKCAVFEQCDSNDIRVMLGIPATPCSEFKAKRCLDCRWWNHYLHLADAGCGIGLCQGIKGGPDRHFTHSCEEFTPNPETDVEFRIVIREVECPEKEMRICSECWYIGCTMERNNNADCPEFKECDDPKETRICGECEFWDLASYCGGEAERRVCWKTNVFPDFWKPRKHPACAMFKERDDAMV